MAIVAPVLIAILFAVVEFGSILYTQHTLVEASRSGARQLAIQGTTEQEAIDIAEDYLSGANISGATVTAQNAYAGYGDDATAREVWVNIELPIVHASLLGDALGVFPSAAVLTAHSSMRKEGELVSAPAP
jgi:Flp pilus assembly protein TadG